VTAVANPVPSERDTLGARLGFRRLDRVVLTVDEDAVRAEVIGVTHRLPRAVPISLACATRLVRAGIPLTLRDQDAEGLDGEGGATAGERSRFDWHHAAPAH
jgi:hypothetical protein